MMIGDFMPVLSVLGTTLRSDRCIWCGESAEMSHTHVVPEYMGGRFAPFLACEKCNNSLGTAVEESGMHNVYLTAALVNTGISPPHKAYRHATKTVEGTGVRHTIKKSGKAAVVPQELSDDTFKGSLKDMERKAVARFRKQQPSKPILPIEEFYRDTVTEELTYCGCKFTKQIFGEEITTLQLSDLSRDVDPRLVFKIAYETLASSNLLRVQWIRTRLRQHFTVSETSAGERIQFDDKLSVFVTSNTEVGFSETKFLHLLPFKRHHYVMLRLSKDHNLYVEVTLFGIIRCLFLLGPWRNCDDVVIPTTSLCIMFPLDGVPVTSTIYPNVKCKNVTGWGDAAMDWRYWQLAKDERYRNML